MAHMEGFFLKKSYISYRSRFFQLDGSNLLYKASKEDVEERNLMTLTGDSQVIEFKAKRGEWILGGRERGREGGRERRMIGCACALKLPLGRGAG